MCSWHFSESPYSPQQLHPRVNSGFQWISVDPLSTSSCKKLRPWAAGVSAGLHVLFFYFRIIQMTKPKKIQWLVPGGSCKSFSTSIVYTAPWSRNFCSNDLHDGVPQWVVGFLFFGGRNSSGSAISFSAAVSLASAKKISNLRTWW